jgi:hypothetical protein
MNILAIDEITGKETYKGAGYFTEEQDPRDGTGAKKALFVNFGGLSTVYLGEVFFMGSIKVEISNLTSEDLEMIRKIENQ